MSDRRTVKHVDDRLTSETERLDIRINNLESELYKDASLFTRRDRETNKRLDNIVSDFSSSRRKSDIILSVLLIVSIVSVVLHAI